MQRSGHPEAYGQWEDQASALAKAFAGTVPAGVSCAFPSPTIAARPTRVVDLLVQDLPATRLTTTDRVAEVRPRTPGWATVSWLVAHADRLGIEAVGYAGQRWSRTEGWRNDSALAADRVRLEMAQLTPKGKKTTGAAG